MRLLCPRSQLGAAYVSATTGAVVTALGLKSLAKVRTGVQRGQGGGKLSDALPSGMNLVCLKVSAMLRHFSSVSLQSSAALSPSPRSLPLTASTSPS